MSIIEYVVQATGKGFEFREQEAGVMETWASVKIACGDQVSHVILYRPDHRGKLGYLVAHECGHILRMHSAPPEYKKLPGVGPDHRRRVIVELESDLHRLARSGLSAEHLGEIVAIWHSGLVRQLGNITVDMRIEKWLYEDYRGMHPLQRQALVEQLRENAKVLSRRVREFTPQKLYKANVAMNAAFARYMSLLLGYDYCYPYVRTEFYPLGRQMADEIWQSPDQGYRGDIGTIEQWSRALGLDEWWQWQSV